MERVACGQRAGTAIEHTVMVRRQISARLWRNSPLTHLLSVDGSCRKFVDDEAQAGVDGESRAVLACIAPGLRRRRSTFSFPAQASYYGSGYGNGEPSNNFEAFSPAQQAAVRSILASYSAVANLAFSEVQETSSQHAVIRYAETDKYNTAFGYYPSTSAAGGDTWFNNSRNYYDNPVKGNYGWMTIIHETGHALGLKHPQDSMGSFGVMPADHDSVEYIGDELPLLYWSTNRLLQEWELGLSANLDDV